MDATIGHAYPGLDGFLGTRGSFAVDLVFLLLFLVVPLLILSIYLVRFHRDYRWHKRMQLSMGIVLLVVVILFELEMRLYGWQARAAPSPYWRDGRWNDWIDWSLAIHLVFAIPTLLLWIWVTVQALRKFPTPPRPAEHSARHRYWGTCAIVQMLLTAVTGWTFYWLAFAS